MSGINACLTGVLFLVWSSAVCCAAGDAAAQDQPPPQPPPPQVRPDQPAGPPPAQRPERPPQASGPQPERPPLPNVEPGAREPDLPGPAQALLRMVRAHRPELAERLARLARQSPDRFHEVLVEALISRLESALDETEAEPGPPGRPERGPRSPVRPRPGPAEPGGPPPGDVLPRVRELEERHGELERQSQELARQMRELGEGADAEVRHAALREQLVRVVNEQFEVRTQLRHMELERMQRELHRIQEMVERLQGQLERRERERPAITERRIGQLLGEDAAGW